MAHGVCLYWSISFTLEMMDDVMTVPAEGPFLHCIELLATPTWQNVYESLVILSLETAKESSVFMLLSEQL